YRSLWYRLSGEPVIDIPMAAISSDTVQQNMEQHIYRVDIKQAGDTLKIATRPKSNPLQKSQTISLKVIKNGAASVHEVALGNAKNSISIPSTGVRNIIVNGDNGLVFKIHKPVPFILYQLDNAENMEAR